MDIIQQLVVQIILHTLEGVVMIYTASGDLSGASNAEGYNTIASGSSSHARR